MIELNKKTQQDFLNREWVQKLLDAGVDMSDAKYVIGIGVASGTEHVLLRKKVDSYTFHRSVIPTYTMSELLYKLHEYIYPTIDGLQYSGGLKFCKDAPFYIWYYALHHENKLNTNNIKEDYIYAEAEYPIESLAALLVQCHQKDIGLVNKDTGNISEK